MKRDSCNLFIVYHFRIVSNFACANLEATYPIKKHFHWRPATTTPATVATTVAATTATLFRPHPPPPPLPSSHHANKHHQFVTLEWHQAEMV